MPCYHPLQLESESVSRLIVACGQCVGCRLERSRQWAVRCVHEASLHESNCFITLTYDAEHVPADGSLVYRDFQLFMKRLRRRFSSSAIRFFMCGEYGEENLRPHFHACLFGFDFPDRVAFRRVPSGFTIYRSECLSDLWGRGFTSVADVTFESAAYVARYVMKKVTGEFADFHYAGRTPEFCHMSLGRESPGGIGSGWFMKYWSELLQGKVVVNGVEAVAPRYYMRMLDKLGLLEDVKDSRFEYSLGHCGDVLPERLLVRESVARARIASLKRTI